MRQLPADGQPGEAGSRPVGSRTGRSGQPGGDRAGSLFARPARARHRLARQADVLAAVGLGGGLGSVARYLCGQAWPARPGGFPWSTFTVNVTGCFALGALMVYVLEVWPPSRYLRPFLGVGVCGGFTTFSTYAVETRDLAAAGHWAMADAYALDTLLAALAGVWLGMVVARLLSGLPPRRRRASTTTPAATGQDRQGAHG
jgi:CrcB protein